MADAILVVNAGSSSLKFAVYTREPHALGSRVLGGQIDGIGQAGTMRAFAANAVPVSELPYFDPQQELTQDDAISALLDWLYRRSEADRIVACGHRVVHGGEKYCAPVVIDDRVLTDLRSFVPLARLHQPYEISAITAIRARRPALTHVACFDTAFHRSQPRVAQLYPLPRGLIESGVRRYGFHGLSYEYIAGELPGLVSNADHARVIVAHLGSGSSMCAMQGGRSVATTMGFTALDGLMMGTRSGSIDPGIVLYLIEERGMSAREVSEILYRRSGLLGVSGISSDMRALLAADDPYAREAVELYVYEVVREAGALAACLGGLDALVFTAGIGEHAEPIRRRVCEALEWLGIELDEHANAEHARRISGANSRISVFVVPTNEELVIARSTHALAASA
jgi:acetate kinase